MKKEKERKSQLPTPFPALEVRQFLVRFRKTRKEGLVLVLSFFRFLKSSREAISANIRNHVFLLAVSN